VHGVISGGLQQLEPLALVEAFGAARARERFYAFRRFMHPDMH
jgi:hypothetical protein